MKVIKRLHEYGFFAAGGVLVGTHAYLAYANMLGVRWGDSSRTQDIDFAHAGKNLSIALPTNLTVATHEAIQSLEMGFLPLNNIAGIEAGSYLQPKDPTFRIDFLTTMHRHREAPFKHEQLNIVLMPLKFMEYSLANIKQSVLISNGESVLVNVPDPARYALHKLIIYGECAGQYQGKANKDLLQAAALIEYLNDNMQYALQDAYQDLVARGKCWRNRLAVGINALEKAYPHLKFSLN